MPHPFKGQGKTIFSYSSLLQRPQLAAYIAAICSAWAGVEEMWGIMLSEMLYSSAYSGVAMYLSLTGSGSQKTVLKTAADINLPDHLKPQFEALMKAEKGLAGERNRVAHGRWSLHPSDEDALILGENNWFAKATADLHHFISGSSEPEFFPQEKTMERFTYKMADFEATLKRIDVYRQSQGNLVSEIQAYRASQSQKRRLSEPQPGPYAYRDGPPGTTAQEPSPQGQLPSEEV